MTENDLSPQVTVVLETSVSQTLTALELRSLLAQRETAVWEQMTASHMAPQETVVNALQTCQPCAHTFLDKGLNFPGFSNVFLVIILESEMWNLCTIFSYFVLHLNIIQQSNIFLYYFDKKSS